MKWNVSPKQRIWIRRLLILFIIRTVIWGALYYIVVYRFKDIMQITVRRESKGTYAFDASEVDFSLWNKNIVVKDAYLYCKDTLREPRHYEVHVPAFYMKIDSWMALIFHRRLQVDSLHILEPSIRTHLHSGAVPINKPVTFHASKILDVLQRVVIHLRVRALVIENGAFRYSNTKHEVPFISDHINLSIRNFSQREPQTDHLFSSDDVDLSIGPQRWQMPDGIHEFSFQRLHFSGSNQLFELDSCTFHTAAVEGRSESTISADKFFFNSRNLASTYEKEELHIDTLICIRPFLDLPLLYRKEQKDTSSRAFNQAVRHLFRQMDFQYIDIQDGKFLLSRNNKSYEKDVSLRLFHLQIDPDREPAIRIDSLSTEGRHKGESLLDDIPALKDLAERKELTILKGR